MQPDEYKHLASLYGMLVEPVIGSLRKLLYYIIIYKPGYKVLDIGCGDGAYLHGLIAKKCHLVGVDVSPAMLRMAHHKLGQNATFFMADTRRLPFDDGSFDIVTAQFLIHELNPSLRAAVFTEMKRVVAANGKIVLVDYALRPRLWPRGWIVVLILLLLEFMAGIRHFRAFLSYVLSGGMAPLLKRAGLSIRKSTVDSGAPAAIFVVVKEEELG